MFIGSQQNVLEKYTSVHVQHSCGGISNTDGDLCSLSTGDSAFLSEHIEFTPGHLEKHWRLGADAALAFFVTHPYGSAKSKTLNDHCVGADHPPGSSGQLHRMERSF